MNGMQITGVILGLTGLALIIISLIRIENGKFRVVTYEVCDSRIKRNVVFAVLADLHNYSYGKGNERLKKAIDQAHPDGIISAGDMIEAYASARGTAETMTFLGELKRSYPFYYGMGNHERRFIERPEKYPEQIPAFRNGIKEEKLHLLRNESIDFPEYGVRLTGLDLERCYFRKFSECHLEKEHIEELVGKPKDEYYNLLIGHNPDHFETYAKWGADGVLSGHIHGGVIAIPGIGGLVSPKLTPFPKYDGGEYISGKCHMFLSRGLGNHTVHMRIFNRAELVILKLGPSSGN